MPPAWDLVVLTEYGTLPYFCFLCCFIINFQIVSALMGEIGGLSAQNLADVGDAMSSCPTGATAWQGWVKRGSQGHASSWALRL